MERYATETTLKCDKPVRILSPDRRVELYSIAVSLYNHARRAFESGNMALPIEDVQIDLLDVDADNLEAVIRFEGTFDWYLVLHVARDRPTYTVITRSEPPEEITSREDFRQLREELRSGDLTELQLLEILMLSLEAEGIF